jgi:hypothetical protein
MAFPLFGQAGSPWPNPAKIFHLRQPACLKSIFRAGPSRGKRIRMEKNKLMIDKKIIARPGWIQEMTT